MGHSRVGQIGNHSVERELSNARTTSWVSTSMSKYNWDQIRTQVKAFRARAHASYPLHALATVKDFHIDGNQRKIYFLSNNQAIDGTLTRHLTLYQVDYHDIAPSLDEHEPLGKYRMHVNG